MKKMVVVRPSPPDVPQRFIVPEGQVPCAGPGPFLNGWETGDIIQKMGDVTHFMEGYFYVGCCWFISISYFLTKFGEW